MNIEKVSVIIPTYNVQPYVRNLLEDVCAQTYRNLEIIVVDDASNDDTRWIIDAMAKRDRRIQLIQQERLGPSQARNAGLKRATGAYVRFVDADDRLPKDSIERMMAVYLQNSKIDLIIGNFKVWGAMNYYQGNDTQNMILDEKNFADFMLSHYQTCYMGVVWNKLYKREIIEANGIAFRLDLYWSEDFFFNMQYFACCQRFYILNCRNGVYSYYIRKNSITSNLWKNYSEKIPQIEHQKYEALWKYANTFQLHRRFELEYEYSRLYDKLSLSTKQHNLSMRIRYIEFVKLLQQQGVPEYFNMKYRKTTNRIWLVLYQAVSKRKYKSIFFLFWMKGKVSAIAKFCIPHWSRQKIR